MAFPDHSGLVSWTVLTCSGESQVIMGSMTRFGNVTKAKQNPKPKEKVFVLILHNE